MAHGSPLDHLRLTFSALTRSRTLYVTNTFLSISYSVSQTKNPFARRLSSTPELKSPVLVKNWSENTPSKGKTYWSQSPSSLSTIAHSRVVISFNPSSLKSTFIIIPNLNRSTSSKCRIPSCLASIGFGLIIRMSIGSKTSSHFRVAIHSLTLPTSFLVIVTFIDLHHPSLLLE